MKRKIARQKPVIIFGASALAELVCFTFLEAGRRVAGFTVDRQYWREPVYAGLPVVPFDAVTRHFDPATHDIFIAFGPFERNRRRAARLTTALAYGYNPASCIAPSAKIARTAKISPHVFIGEQVTIAANAQLGVDVILLADTVVEKNAIIGDHAYAMSGARITAGKRIAKYGIIIPAATTANFSYGKNSGTFPPLLTAKLTTEMAAHFARLEKTRTPKPLTRGTSALTDICARLNWLCDALASGWGHAADFHRYVTLLKYWLPHLPLWLAAGFELTAANLPRWRLLGDAPLIYPGFFADQKQLKRLFADRLQQLLPAKRASKPRTNGKRVMFSRSNIDLYDTNITNIARKFKLMQARWPDVRFYFLVSDDYYISPADNRALWQAQKARGNLPYLLVKPGRYHSRANHDNIARAFQDEGLEVEFFFTDPEKPYERRMRDAFDWVQSIQPDIILTFNIDSLFDNFLYRLYPLLRFSTGEFNPILYGEADIYITPHQIDDLAPIVKQHRLTRDLSAYAHIHIPVKAIAPSVLPTRRDIGLKPKTFYLASISRHYEVGIYEDVARQVLAFLDRHPQARWLIVGLYKGQWPRGLDHPHIIKWPEKTDAIGITLNIDLLVPVTPGTGITALSAMQAGIPVLGLDRRPSPLARNQHALTPDVAIYLGDLAHKTVPALGRQLGRLYTRPDSYRQAAAAMRQRATELIAERDAGFPRLLDTVTLAEQKFRHRTAKARKARPLA